MSHRTTEAPDLRPAPSIKGAVPDSELPPRHGDSLRVRSFLDVLSAVGGKAPSDGGWVAAFQGAHERRSPDTFSIAAASGYVAITCDDGPGSPVVHLTDKGRLHLAGEAGPCIDEGCPHFGTGAICRTPDEPDGCRASAVRPGYWTTLRAYQLDVADWREACFGGHVTRDKEERCHRFLEEALELVQSLGCTRHEALQLVDYVYGRPVGDATQEVGGTMITLSILCSSHGIDLEEAALAELNRISSPEMLAKIAAKQAAKPKHSPLPEASQGSARSPCDPVSAHRDE